MPKQKEKWRGHCTREEWRAAKERWAARVEPSSESRGNEARCAVSPGSASPTYEQLGNHVRRAFVIYEEPGKIPQKKGPFVRDSEVEKMLREMKPHHHPDTRYTVAEITFDFDLWLTTASEFLTLQEIARMQDDDEPNNKITNAPPSGE